MLKVTYAGEVPEGYLDSGKSDISIFIAYPVDGKGILELAKRDAYMATDCEFQGIISVEEYEGKIPWPCSIYKGKTQHYDSYFNMYLDEHIVDCGDF